MLFCALLVLTLISIAVHRGRLYWRRAVAVPTGQLLERAVQKPELGMQCAGSVQL